MKHDQTTPEQGEVAEVDPRFAREQRAELERRRPNVWSDEQLRTINSFEDLAAAVAARDDVGVANAADFGNGYSVCDNKDSLIGVDMFIIDWRFGPGKFGEYVSAQVLTRDGRKLIVNDGSTGIYAQLKDVSKALGGDDNTIVTRVPKGLRRSDYTYEAINAKTGDITESEASTYYISYDS